MISGLLKRARLYGQLTVNVLLNPVNQVANFIIPCDNSQLFVVTRNVTSSTGIHTQNKEKLSEKLKNMEIRMLQSRWTNKIEIEHVLNDISSKDDIGPSEALLVLRWCDKIMDCLPLERVKFGEYVWSHLFVCNIPLGVHHYNELLQIYLQNDYDFSPEKFLKEMANNGISPNIITYEKCIRYCCKKRKYDLATQFMRHMMNQNLTPTESIYNSLLWGSYQNGNMKSVNAILAYMNTMKNSFTNTERYTILLCMYAEKNEIDKIRALMKQCRSLNIKLSNKDILDLIYTLTVNKNTEYINSMLSYLDTSSRFSSHEIRCLLKFIYINEIDIVSKILSCIQDAEVAQLILQNLVYSSKKNYVITSMCSFLQKMQMCADPFLWAVYYSFFNDDTRVCLTLLKVCKYRHKIKPHYFWPLLIKNAELYDFKGILDILMIMRREFKVVPCIETISDYVLPFSFGTIPTVRKLLSIYGIDKVVIDNAYVLFLLKQYKSIKADYYMNIYPGPYMYNAIGDELREVYIFRSDVRNYVNIGVKLVHHSCPNVESIENIASLKRINPVSIDRHILDYMFYYPKDHKRLIKIITYLAETNYKITDSTARKVYNFIKPHGTYNVDSMLKRISNKMRNVQID